MVITNNRSFIWLIFIFGLVFLTACSETEFRGNYEGLQKQSLISTDAILDKCKCREDCYGEKIYDYCLHENVETPAQCKELVGTHLGQSYDGSVKYYFNEKQLDTCYKSLISRQSNADLCSEFPTEYSYGCFYFIGKKNFEPKHCRGLPYSYKSDCYLHISNNHTEFSLNLCDELNPDDKIICYSNNATINSDSSICLELESKSDKNNCYSQIRKSFDNEQGYQEYENSHYETIYNNWFKSAKIDSSILDQSYCEFEGATGENYHGKNNTCYMSIAIYHKNLNECYILSRDDGGIDMVRKCLFYTALLNDFELNDCDKLGVDFKECKEGVVFSKRNPELCKEVFDSAVKQGDCIYKIATDYFRIFGQKDIMLCPESGNIHGCIREIYDENNENFLKKEVCHVLSKSNEFLTHSSKCYHKIGLKNLDLDSCEKIDDGYSDLKFDCKERVGRALSVG